MPADIREHSAAGLRDYAGIPIAFEVTEILDVELRQGGLGGIHLRRRALAMPYVKDYDAIDGGPSRWPERFDLSRWGLFAAYVGDERIGGAAVAAATPGLVLEDRTDLAVLWDIRVSPAHRGRGVGSALLSAAAGWAAARGCSQLRVETQNVNVPACAFYLRHGFALGAIHRFAYPTLPDEVQLLWYRRTTARVRRDRKASRRPLG